MRSSRRALVFTICCSAFEKKAPGLRREPSNHLRSQHLRTFSLRLYHDCVVPLCLLALGIGHRDGKAVALSRGWRSRNDQITVHVGAVLEAVSRFLNPPSIRWHATPCHYRNAVIDSDLSARQRNWRTTG